MAEWMQPDFECVGCSNEIFGKEPLYCPKCNGTRFERRAVLKVHGFDEGEAAIERIRREAIGLRKAFVRLKFRNGRKIIHRMYAIEAAARNALRLLTESSNPDENKGLEAEASPRKMRLNGIRGRGERA